MAVFSSSSSEMSWICTLSLMYCSIIMQLPSSIDSSWLISLVFLYSWSSSLNFSLPADSLCSSFFWQLAMSCWKLSLSSFRLFSNLSSVLLNFSSILLISSSFRLHSLHSLHSLYSSAFCSCCRRIFCRYSTLLRRSEISCSEDCTAATTCWRRVSASCWQQAASSLAFLTFSSRLVSFLKKLSSPSLNLGVDSLIVRLLCQNSCRVAESFSFSIFRRSISESLHLTSSQRVQFSCSSFSRVESSRLRWRSMGLLERGKPSAVGLSLPRGSSLYLESNLAAVEWSQLELLAEEGVLLTLLSAIMRRWFSLRIFSMSSILLILECSSASVRLVFSSYPLRMLLESRMNLLSRSLLGGWGLSGRAEFLRDSLSTNCSIRRFSMFLKDCSPFSRSTRSSFSSRFFSSSSRMTFSRRASFSFLVRSAPAKCETVLLRSTCMARRLFSWLRSLFCSLRDLLSDLTRLNSSQSWRYLASWLWLSEGATCDRLLSSSNFSSFSSAFFILLRMSSTSIVVCFIMLRWATSGLGDLHGQFLAFRFAMPRIIYFINIFYYSALNVGGCRDGGGGGDGEGEGVGWGVGRILGNIGS